MHPSILRTNCFSKFQHTQARPFANHTNRTNHREAKRDAENELEVAIYVWSRSRCIQYFYIIYSCDKASTFCRVLQLQLVLSCAGCTHRKLVSHWDGHENSSKMHFSGSAIAGNEEKRCCVGIWSVSVIERLRVNLNLNFENCDLNYLKSGNFKFQINSLIPCTHCIRVFTSCRECHPYFCFSIISSYVQRYKGDHLFQKCLSFFECHYEHHKNVEKQNISVGLHNQEICQIFTNKKNVLFPKID